MYGGRDRETTHHKDGYVFTVTYDAQKRMTSLEYTDSSGVQHRQFFRYSGHGLLADQLYVLNDGILVNNTRLVRDGMLVIQDRDINNTVQREYTWGLNLGGGIGGLLNLNSAGQNYAYLYDGKGNVEAVLDNTQAVVAAYRYDPFGVLLAKTGSFEQPYGFSTKRTDPRTGLVFYEYRPYDPPAGRWLTRDPLGEAGGLNLYAFVGNNPINWVDPWGLTRLRLSIDFDALIQRHQALQRTLDVLPEFLLEMFFPTTPEGMASALESQVMGMVCPLTISGSGANAGKNLLNLAKKFGLNVNSPTTQQILTNLDMPVNEFIGLFRKGSIKQEFPKEFMKKTLKQALTEGGSKVRKLLIDTRFVK